MLGIFLLLGTKLGFKHGFKYDCMKVHLSRIHSLPAVCQASIVSCGALPFSSLPLPQPALCFSAHHSHLLCTTQCSLYELLLLYTAELRTMLCLPLLSVTSLTIITVSKAGIPLALLSTDLCSHLLAAQFLSHRCRSKTAHGGSNAV